MHKLLTNCCLFTVKSNLKKVFKDISDIVSIPICKIIEEDLENEIYKPHISSLLIFGFNNFIRPIQEIINPRFVIGYSIGQYSALHFSKSIDFESTVSFGKSTR